MHVCQRETYIIWAMYDVRIMWIYKTNFCLFEWRGSHWVAQIHNIIVCHRRFFCHVFSSVIPPLFFLSLSHFLSAFSFLWNIIKYNLKMYICICSYMCRYVITNDIRDFFFSKHLGLIWSLVFLSHPATASSLLAGEAFNHFKHSTHRKISYVVFD